MDCFGFGIAWVDRLHREISSSRISLIIRDNWIEHLWLWRETYVPVFRLDDKNFEWYIILMSWHLFIKIYEELDCKQPEQVAFMEQHYCICTGGNWLVNFMFADWILSGLQRSKLIFWQWCWWLWLHGLQMACYCQPQCRRMNRFDF